MKTLHLIWGDLLIANIHEHFTDNVMIIKGALFKLKQKKLYEQEIDKIQNIKMTLETQVMNVSL